MNRDRLGILGGIFLFVFMSYTPAHAVSIGLNVLDDYIEVGETFGVEVWVDGEGINEALLGFGFDVLTGEPDILTYSGHTVGNDFVSLPNFGTLPDAWTGGGGLSFGDLTLLATLSFEANQEGSSGIMVDGIFDGMFYGLIYENPFSVHDISAAVDITVNAAPVPEPATILLLITGIGALVGSRRNKLEKNKG